MSQATGGDVLARGGVPFDTEPDCGSASGVALEPIAAGTEAISVVCAGTAGGQLERGGSLVIRLRLARPVTGIQLFVDVDGRRTTGMWSSQAAPSASGWDLLVEDGTLYRHTGQSNEWRWRPISSGRMDLRADRADLRIGPGELGRPSRVWILAVADGSAVPGRFLPGAAFPPQPLERLDPRIPSRLAIFYSPRPWIVRECSNVAMPVISRFTEACNVAVFSKFEHVVFAGGLEEPTHPGFGPTSGLVQAIADEAPGTQTWGYISFIGLPDADGDGTRDQIHDVEEIRRRAESWRSMGAKGIFLDEVGACAPSWQDCPISPDGREVAFTRERLVAVVGVLHELDLPVFANGFSLPEVLHDHDGGSSPLGAGASGRPADAYLIETPTLGAGARIVGLNAEVSEAKYRLASHVSAVRGVGIAAVDTASGVVSDEVSETTLYRDGWLAAATAGTGAYGFTNPSFSARDEASRNLAILDPPPGGLGARPGPSTAGQSAPPDVPLPGGCTTRTCVGVLGVLTIQDR